MSRPAKNTEVDELKRGLIRAMNDLHRLQDGIRHVINDSPGTPASVKKYLANLLRPENERG